MKKISALILMFSLIVIPVSFSVAEDVQQDSASIFNVGRFVIAGSIDNREPVGIVDVFSSSTEKVYCFLEARDIKEDTVVSFVWYHGEKEVANVDLPLRVSQRWRTYASKKLGGRLGEWKVELQDANGLVVETVPFTVE